MKDTVIALRPIDMKEMIYRAYTVKDARDRGTAL